MVDIGIFTKNNVYCLFYFFVRYMAFIHSFSQNYLFALSTKYTFFYKTQV